MKHKYIRLLCSANPHSTPTPFDFLQHERFYSQSKYQTGVKGSTLINDISKRVISQSFIKNKNRTQQHQQRQFNLKHSNTREAWPLPASSPRLNRNTTTRMTHTNTGSTMVSLNKDTLPWSGKATECMSRISSELRTPRAARCWQRAACRLQEKTEYFHNVDNSHVQLCLFNTRPNWSRLKVRCIMTQCPSDSIAPMF